MRFQQMMNWKSLAVFFFFLQKELSETLSESLSEGASDEPSRDQELSVSDPAPPSDSPSDWSADKTSATVIFLFDDIFTSFFNLVRN